MFSMLYAIWSYVLILYKLGYLWYIYINIIFLTRNKVLEFTSLLFRYSAYVKRSLFHHVLILSADSITYLLEFFVLVSERYQ